jgi:hypothetical protein
MSKKIARLLKADIQESSDLREIARMLAGKGRGGDTLLAHITPKEANILKEAGGAGTTNPETGLLEFFDFSNYDSSSGSADREFVPTFGDYSVPAQPDTSSYGAMQQGNFVPTFGDFSVPAPPDVSRGVPGFGAEVIGNQNVQPSPLLDLKAPSAGPAAGSAAAQERQALIGRGAPTGDKEKQSLNNQDLIRLGLAGGLGVYGAMQQGKAAEQAQKAAGEQKAVARPYQDEGRKLIEAAQRGELTAAGQQQLQGLQAQLAQGAEARGGVGAAQAAAQAQAFRNQLLQNQYDYGLRVSQIGDNIALGAIRTGMQLDQQLNQANMAFYTQLGTLAAGVPTYQTGRS